ncbi:MAG: hypothetical protein KA758_03940 [Acidimicrobiales bacterium]|nr:hypothetical protein [Acidimicrobiales bacterium]
MSADDRVCLLTSMTKGVIKTRCGRTCYNNESWTSWASSVTCPECKGGHS